MEYPALVIARKYKLSLYVSKIYILKLLNITGALFFDGEGFAARVLLGMNWTGTGDGAMGGRN
jgi:hypothetical protein